MFEIKTDGNPESPREPIFSIDGTEYTIPVEVGAEIALEAMHRSRTEQDAAVTAWCVEQCIGADAFRALRSVKGLDPAIVRGIMQICRDRVFGSLEQEGKD